MFGSEVMSLSALWRIMQAKYWQVYHLARWGTGNGGNIPPAGRPASATTTGSVCHCLHVLSLHCKVLGQYVSWLHTGGHWLTTRMSSNWPVVSQSGCTLVLVIYVGENARIINHISNFMCNCISSYVQYMLKSTMHCCTALMDHIQTHCCIILYSLRHR